MVLYVYCGLFPPGRAKKNLQRESNRWPVYVLCIYRTCCPCEEKHVHRTVTTLPKHRLRLRCYRDERICSLCIAPTIQGWRCHTQRAKHAADLLAMLGRMVNDLNDDNPTLHEKSIRGSELSR